MNTYTRPLSSSSPKALTTMVPSETATDAKPVQKLASGLISGASLAVSVHVPPSYVNTYATYILLTTTVFPSTDTECPKYSLALPSVGANLAVSIHAPPSYVNTYAEPLLFSSPEAPTTAVFPSTDTEYPRSSEILVTSLSKSVSLTCCSNGPIAPLVAER